MPKGQMKIVFGIVVVLLILGAIFGFRAFFGKSEEAGEEKKPSSQEVKIAAEMAGSPVRSNLLPTGTLSAGTSETKISVNTNEPGYCRYSTEPGQPYDSITGRFSYDKNKTFHSTKVQGLQNGQTYTYYVRCRDLAGDKNEDDAQIQFSIGGVPAAYSKPSGPFGPDLTPPGLSNLLPGGTLPAGTTETQISVNTNEPGYCRYSSQAGQAYDSMSANFSYNKDKVLHTAKVRGLTDNKVYQYYVRCRDLAGNKNTEDSQIRFGVGGVSVPAAGVAAPGQDLTPPYRFDASPLKDQELPFDTKSTIISLKTDEKATCRYSTVSGTSYDSMSWVFSNSNGTAHSTVVTGLSEGQNYQYYIKCADEQANKNTNDFLISFKVKMPVDYTPAMILNPYPAGDTFAKGTSSTTISISTNEPASCRYSSQAGTPYKSMNKSFSYNATKTFHTAKITGLENGKNYEYFARCQDLAGNANTGDVMIHFGVASQ